ncbi:recQ-mediated genome instability protein 1-like [Rutidosis leptorrhynchoides]|uniref:recQ-mediated genome instability protein 1-like n=1 Tax=Rutidosis leptorrhynchoides TaxID=125765 RepID=UPI003A99F1B0
MSSRRRLRIITSSDEEDNDDDLQEVQPPLPPPQQQQHNDDNEDIEFETLNLHNVTLNPQNPNNPSNSVPIDISDEDFLDAFEDLSSPPPPPPPPPQQSQQTTNSTESSGTHSSVGMSEPSDNPVSRILEELGLRLRNEWLDSCIQGLQAAVHGFSSFDDDKKAKLCFEKFLNCDMNYCGSGLLPNNVHQMHLVDLPGPFVLQVDEIVNISQPLRDRYKKANCGLKRCLKLSMTDGVQRVFGMEYQPIKDLEALAPAGLKVAISNVNVRHGLLMLVPEVIQVLGGVVEELDEARQRLVNEVNKPPRGKRTRSGVVPPLATRATRAAWPTDNTDVSQPSINPNSQRATPMQVDDRGPAPASVNRRVSSNSAIPVHREPAAHNQPITEVDSSFSTRRGNIEPFPSTSTTNSATPVYMEPATHNPPRTEPDSSFSARRENIQPVPIHREPTTHNPTRNKVNSSFSTSGETNEPLPSTSTTNSAIPVTTESSVNLFTEQNAPFETPLRGREEVSGPIHMESHVSLSDDEDVEMAAADERHHSLSKSNESPFTYLSSLSLKWSSLQDKTSHVEGKIKCIVTGVKGFQFKGRSTYMLQVYVDDGSLISEILVDHNVVQQRIGYSPEEVNTALSSSDSKRVQDMKNTVNQFQVYLVNFEGTMVVLMNGVSSLPVAVEMVQGCSVSDAWLLLKRLKSSNAESQASQCPPLDPILLSP